MINTGGLGEWIRHIVTNATDYMKPWSLINQYEGGVILRWGKYHRTLTPGVKPKWPIAEFQLTTLIETDTMETGTINITTLDGKTIAIGGVIKFDVVDTKKYLVDNNDSPTNMKDLARGIISDLIEEVNWVDIKKKTTKNAVQRRLSAEFEDMGVRVMDFNFNDKCEMRAIKLFTDSQRPLDPANLML